MRVKIITAFVTAYLLVVGTVFYISRTTSASLIDNLTGCQYVTIVDNLGRIQAIAPRMMSDGTQLCSSHNVRM